MPEPTEAQIARLDERLSTVLNELSEARNGRKYQYEKLEEMGRTVLQISNRVESVEKSLAKASPTIDEFLTIKHKVVGAGIAGKWVWAAASAIITGLIMSRDFVMRYLGN